jgi:dipeptidyl aminopeptidase/acylaminoacyl peptidase
MKSILAIAVVALVAAQQQPPATEVYLAAFPAQAGGVLQFVNISNSPGYDNQPSFLPDGSAVLFSSNRDGKQTDIYRYDIASKQLKQLTASVEGEFSPTVTPDGRSFSAVRQDPDGTQRLWRFDLDGSNPRVILDNVRPVGYHAWIDETHLALFILGAGGGAPATLQLADTKTGTATVAVTGIGRSLLIRPKAGTISYLASGETPRVLKELDLKTGTSTTLIAPLEGSQDAAWTPDGRLLMARGTSISMWRPGTTAWQELATAGPGVGSITRLTVSADGKWLAFVAEPR